MPRCLERLPAHGDIPSAVAEHGIAGLPPSAAQRADQEAHVAKLKTWTGCRYQRTLGVLANDVRLSLLPGTTTATAVATSTSML